ncbi:DNA-3-methyladenine glycosylase [Marinospirillum celere]|uniref:Putative 3-methyladenine DNA glycosylase n=1 Tax=Marinospirillum celere TaxID=1122252 RepID=A0A1I1G5P4_9GAMM|nr:DNA-3-methyladenine glycosylase [Marinospirillum celere]SFC07057.1 DNA-3-methyladenine glycosylase [Marinospirillum celere]
MKFSVLERAFYARPTLEVAEDLLGCLLVRELPDGQQLAARIVDLEAYIGEEDSACHASKGRTPRTQVMYGPPGHAYVYLIYGLHHLLNLVTEEAGRPCGVMLRAVQPLHNEEAMRALRQVKGRNLCNGPGKLTAALAVNKDYNQWDMTLGEQLWVAPRSEPLQETIQRGPRIGIDYAEPEDREAPWRFWLAENPWRSLR